MKKKMNRQAASTLLVALLLAAVLFSTFSPTSAAPARGGPKGTEEPTQEGPGTEAVPSGFFSILSDTGVVLYKKDYPGGQPDYVQVVSLDKGAYVSLMHGTIASAGTGKGPFGGDNPTFNRNTLQSVWNSFSGSNSGAFCVLNGGFFSTSVDPAPLTFSLKKDGKIVSDGYGSTTEFPGERLMLELWSDRADIKTLTKDALYNSSAPNILGGLAETADKDKSTYTGRTFAGIDDANNDGKYETVLFFNSAYSNQADTAAVLRAFGADKVIMFDGGASTQLNCRNTGYVSSSRTIPQTIGVVKGGGGQTGEWREEYFNGKNFETRCYDDFEGSTYIFRKWGTAAPAASCNSDNFSARFTRSFDFSGGTYTFHCQHNDGCRIYIDGVLKGNWWVDSAFTGNNWSGTLSGRHEVKIEFYDATGDARLEAFWWGAGFLPAKQTCTTAEWCARYYGNTDLAGIAALLLNEGKANINKNWGTGGIGYGFPTDRFSVRWLRTPVFEAGRYRFHMKVDDGGRLYVNGKKVIDQWKDQSVKEFTVDLDLPAGSIPLKFEYYENAGDAVAQVWWEEMRLQTASIGAQDGWVLESAENSNMGGTLNSTMTHFYLGDDEANRQYRSILSFDTASLPDNATITSATLKIKRAAVVGTNPFTTHMGLKVDIRKPYFGPAAGLSIGDFQAIPGRLAVGTFNAMPDSNWWYSTVLDATAYPYINLGGTTQLRLRFARDDNDDLGADYLKFFSGNYGADPSFRPQLIITYTLP